ncbi:cold-shock protein [Desulfotomaculum copahuensis]|uniref:CSD domain-containing protein n=1 Tax=Desulfotomaculum copahuensis TaxID=1838280 RepID=A0A1B7LAJ5_9FIRM|nr:cold shock domain-containing protein [Desulfotomaculum copahuensis]OAT79320.1 hypothetical protein A6M21_16290 [Desulfotomaculum copahuensis]
METKKGYVLRLFRSKGFGFIMGEDGESLFFHISGTDGFEGFNEGLNVEYKVRTDTSVRNGGKPMAIGVARI